MKCARWISLNTPSLLSLAAVCGLTVSVVISTSGQVAGPLSSDSRPGSQRLFRSLVADPWVQFVIGSVNQYAISSDPADNGKPIVPLYTDYNAGGTYGLPDDITNVTVDADDPDADHGTSSYLVTWNGSGYFQFDIGCPADGNRIRSTADLGLARIVRFNAKADTNGRQLTVNVFRGPGPPNCTYSQVASHMFALTTSWMDYPLDISALGLTPQDLHAVQFVMGSPGSVRLDDVRIDSDGFDPYRGIQSYVAKWAAADSPPNTPAWRDANIYPNHSYLYDNALAIEALLTGGDTSDAAAIADGRMETAPDCTGGFFNELNSGHTLVGNGSPRGSFSMRKRLGDNSWFGLALLDLFYVTRNTNYQNCAIQLSDWAETNLKASGQYEGYYAGYDDSGNLLTSRSVEENSDLFELNSQLAALLGEPYTDRATWAGTFVVAMFQGGKFWAGTSSDDTIQTASVPLDAQTIPYLTLGQSQQYATAVSYTSALAWAESNLIVTDNGYTGFTYSTGSKGQNPARVWFEGVAQACVAYELLGRLEGVSLDPWGAKVPACLQTLEAASMNGTGVLAASGDDLKDDVFNTIYDARLAIAPTAWAVRVRSLLALR